MELKRFSASTNLRLHILLIVPYGIETHISPMQTYLKGLLIAPYGIETQYFIGYRNTELKLLIVPYGIETLLHRQDPIQYHPFNRTLWN